jgi:hypothetical protein
MKNKETKRNKGKGKEKTEDVHYTVSVQCKYVRWISALCFRCYIWVNYGQTILKFGVCANINSYKVERMCKRFRFTRERVSLHKLRNILHERTNQFYETSYFWQFYFRTSQSIKNNLRFGGSCRVHLQDQPETRTLLSAVFWLDLNLEAPNCTASCFTRQGCHCEPGGCVSGFQPTARRHVSQDSTAVRSLPSVTVLTLQTLQARYNWMLMITNMAVWETLKIFRIWYCDLPRLVGSLWLLVVRLKLPPPSSVYSYPEAGVTSFLRNVDNHW